MIQVFRMENCEMLISVLFSLFHYRKLSNYLIFLFTDKSGVTCKCGDDCKCCDVGSGGESRLIIYFLETKLIVYFGFSFEINWVKSRFSFKNILGNIQYLFIV